VSKVLTPPSKRFATSAFMARFRAKPLCATVVCFPLLCFPLVWLSFSFLCSNMFPILCPKFQADFSARGLAPQLLKRKTLTVKCGIKLPSLYNPSRFFFAVLWSAQLFQEALLRAKAQCQKASSTLSTMLWKAALVLSFSPNMSNSALAGVPSRAASTRPAAMTEG